MTELNFQQMLGRAAQVASEFDNGTTVHIWTNGDRDNPIVRVWAPFDVGRYMTIRRDGGVDVSEGGA